jgi:hypothetical protein
MTDDFEEGNLPFFNRSLWQAVAQLDSVNYFLQSADQSKVGSNKVISIAIFNRDISPLDLYCYLKARFGEPNGYQMIAKKEDSDNLFQWHYDLVCENNHMHFLGLTDYIRVIIEFDRKITNIEWKLLPKSLKDDYRNWGLQKSEILKGLEKWRLFINPYRRILSVVDRLCEEIEKLGNAIEYSYNDIQSHIDLAEQQIDKANANNDFTSNTHELMEKGLCLKFLVPVLAESFVNLIIFILVNDDIKNNDDLYQETIREHIYKRVTTLPSKCKGFEKNISVSDNRFQDFQRIMDSRNDFLHGNVDPKKFGFEDLYFDRFIPLFKEGGSIFRRVNKSSLKFIEPSQVRNEVRIVKEFCDFILEHLNESVRAQFVVLLNCIDPGWNIHTNRVGILLPSRAVDFFMSGDSDVFIDSKE